MDWTAIILLSITVTGGLLTLILQFILKRKTDKLEQKSDEYHKLVNSRMDELLRLARAEGAQEGKDREIADQKLREGT